MFSVLTYSCCCSCCCTGWSLTSENCLILLTNLVKSLRTSHQFMPVRVGINDGPFFNKVFWSSENTALDKLIVFWSVAFSIISLMSSFFLPLYRLPFPLLLSTAIFLLNLLFLFGVQLYVVYSLFLFHGCVVILYYVQE